MNGCRYCDMDESFRSVLFEVCELSVSRVFLCRDQTLPGRCTIAFKEHVEELYQLSEEQRNSFISDVCLLQKAITELFHPDKLNIAYYGDKCRHVHFTICPKYEGKLGWGVPFVNFPGSDDIVILSDKEYSERINLIKEELSKLRFVNGEFGFTGQ